MKCPKCGYIESKVIDSRPTDDFTSVRRRRECLECKNRFTTYEYIENVPMVVVKKDGTRESFDRDKIIKGIIRACEKRPVSMEKIEALVSKIESELNQSSQGEISTAEIGEAVMRNLKDIDDVAYVRFASVYRQFKDINTFMEEMKALLQNESENK